MARRSASRIRCVCGKRHEGRSRINIYPCSKSLREYASSIRSDVSSTSALYISRNFRYAVKVPHFVESPSFNRKLFPNRKQFSTIMNRCVLVCPLSTVKSIDDARCNRVSTLSRLYDERKRASLLSGNPIKFMPDVRYGRLRCTCPGYSTFYTKLGDV